MSIHFKTKAAFTLAEVLITLGIIGVVAAITIPGLINNYKALRLRSQFFKSYSTIQQAFKYMQADDVSLDPSDYLRSKTATTFLGVFKNYFRVAVDCGEYYTGTRQSAPCYAYKSADKYKTYDGNNTVDTQYFDDGQIVLQDGTLIIYEHPTSNIRRWIMVDLNGYGNPPNRWGYDLFTFEFIDWELVPMGDQKSSYTDMDKYCSLTSSNTLNGLTCAQKAKENVDYFKYVVKNLK